MAQAEILTKFTADTSQVDKATKNWTSSIGQLAKGFAIGELAAKGISKAIAVFNENLDGAIKRTDTLNNFPKVMSNLGIGAEDAQKSIDTLSEKLTGLPTSLDSAAMAVQRFTSANGDVNKSTTEFLALNNALLAGGASADIQSTALEQISQAYAKGKPDMMEWRSMMTAMPAQLKQVASAMGYVDASALGEALRDGSVSMDQFMQTITKLNTEGVGDFASFEEQARNSTGGIQTSITNMKTAFVRGIGDIINGLNEGLSEFGGLSGVISKLGKIGEKAFKGLGSVIKQILPPLIQLGKQIMPTIQEVFNQVMPSLMSIASQLLPAIVNIINQLVPFLAQIITTILPILVDLINEFLPPIIEIVDMILPLLIELLTPVLDLIKPVVGLLKPIISALLQIIKPLVEILQKILPPLVKLLTFIIENTMPLLQDAVENAMQGVLERVQIVTDYVNRLIESWKKIFGGITDFIKGVFTGNWSQAWEGVKSIFTGIFDGLVAGAKVPLNLIISNINKVIRGINNIKIPDWDIFGSLAGKSLNIPTIPSLNVGTNLVPEDTLAMIHKGEAVIPKKFNPYANGINSNTLASMGTQNTIIVNVENNMEMDTLGQMVNKIKTYSGGAKNDFNFGMGR